MAFPEKLAEWVKGEVKGLFGDFYDNVNSGNPEYLLNGEPTSTIGKLNQATGRQLCRRWARVTTGIASPDNFAYARMCKPYLEDIGEYPGDPGLAIGFEGGQCAAGYQIVATWVRGDDGTPGTSTFEEVGPISGPFQGLVDGLWRAWVIRGDGAVLGFGYATPFYESRMKDIAITVSPFPPGSFVDNCGNQGVNPTAPPNALVDEPLDPITVTNPGVSVDIDVDINPDGTIRIIFDPEGDPVEPDPFDPNDPPVEPENDPTLPDEPGDIGEPGTPVNTGVGGDTGEVNSDEYLMGVQVDILTVSPRANVRYPGGEPIYFGAGYVFLGTPGNLDLQPEGQTMKDPQFFFAPRGSNSYRVVANQGYNLKVTPFYKPSE